MTNNTSISAYFAEDHDRLDNLFLKFREKNGRNIEETQNFFKSFKKGLEQHIVWEETIIFPLFEEKTGMIGNGPTAVMRLEHQEIKRLLSEIDLDIDKSKEFHAHEQALFKILSEHNAKEEEILYPMIDDIVSEIERNAIFERISTTKDRGGCSCCGIHV